MLARIAARSVRLAQNSVSHLARLQTTGFPRLRFGAVINFPVTASGIRTTVVRTDPSTGQLWHVGFLRSKVLTGAIDVLAVFIAHHGAMTGDAVIGVLTVNRVGLGCDVVILSRVTAVYAGRG